MKQLMFSIVLITLTLFSYAQKPMEGEIKEAIKKNWEKPGSSASPKKTIAVNNVKIGTSGKSTLAQQKAGIPKDVIVTHAKVYFHETLHKSDGGKNSKKEMRVWVYKDMEEWKVRVLEVVAG